MFRKSFQAAFVVLLVLAFSSAALALPPQDALSVRPAESIYTVLCVNDLSGVLKEIFSQANLDMVIPLVPPDEAEGIKMIAGIASQIPAKSVLISAGMSMSGPFVQAAVSIPASLRKNLDSVAKGDASPGDLFTLLAGEGGMMFAGMFSPEPMKGAKGPYYSLMGQVAIAAKDDLLLIASSLEELEASIGALEKKENRLSFKRRFDSPNYWLMHMDMPTMTALATAFGGDVSAISSHVDVFKAPMELEFGVTSKPDSVLISTAVNILECLANSAMYKDMKPAKGANLLQAGGGKLVLALSSPLLVDAAQFKAYPETAFVWGEFIKHLGMINITEGEIEDLLNGAFSLALGSDATVMGANIPGGYLALTGRNGAAAKILEKIMALPDAPLVPLKADGWDSLFVADPAALPIPLTLGVMKETLFAGVVNSDSLSKTPAVPAEISKLLDNPLFGIGFVDVAGIWNWFKQELANPSSLITATIPEEAKGVLSLVMEADLSVPLIKLWSTELDNVFMEFSIIDVPKEKMLLPRLISIMQMFMDN